MTPERADEIVAALRSDEGFAGGGHEMADALLLVAEDRESLDAELKRLRRAFADVEAELRDFRAVARGRT